MNNIGNVLGPMDGDGDGQTKNIDFEAVRKRWQYNLQVKCREARDRALEKQIEKQAQHRDQQLQHGGEPGQHYNYYQGQNQGMMQGNYPPQGPQPGMNGPG